MFEQGLWALFLSDLFEDIEGVDVGKVTIAPVYGHAIGSFHIKLDRIHTSETNTFLCAKCNATFANTQIEQWISM